MRCITLKQRESEDFEPVADFQRQIFSVLFLPILLLLKQ